MSDTAIARHGVPGAVVAADVMAKAGLLMLLVFALAYPDLSHMKDKAAGLRAIGYPLASFAIPFVWWLQSRDRDSFPWLPDLLVTLTCFTDVLGNRMNLYDTIFWFDDWMHFMNTGLLAAAVIMLTLPCTSTFPRTLERALAFGATAAIAWEIAEFFAFISGSSERAFAYADTLGDLALGVIGAATAAFLVHRAWQDERTDQPLISVR